jgi:hypothetical protein
MRGCTGRMDATTTISTPYSINRIYNKMDGFLYKNEHLAIKSYWRSGGIAPRLLNLSTRRRLVVSFTPRQLYPQGKNPWYPLDRRLGGSQNRSGRGGEEKNSQPLPGFEPPDHLARSPALYHWANSNFKVDDTWRSYRDMRSSYELQSVKLQAGHNLEHLDNGTRHA